MKLHSMKLNLFLSSAFSAPVFLFSCSSDETNATERSNDSAAETTENTTPASTGCCFTQESDFAPYFPAPTSVFIAEDGSFASSFHCGNDEDNKRSSANKAYLLDTTVFSDPRNYKSINLDIEDWCSKPDELKAKHDRMKQTSLDYAKTNTNVTVTDMKKDGVYYGYSVVDKTKGNNASSVVIFVVVGDRFKVYIQGIDHTSIEHATQLLDLVPTDKLAGAGE
jgi:hypothetical protein